VPLTSRARSRARWRLLTGALALPSAPSLPSGLT
jgi:hypothetical protein